MYRRQGTRRRPFAILGNLALAVLGVGLALGLTEGLLRANPNWVPRGVRVSPPVRRVHAHVDETYDVKLSDGDLFHWMQGALRPVAPEQDDVVTQVHYTTDADGFRNSLPERTTYDIVALGDSFTVAANVSSPWPQQLAECMGWPVLNLGEAGAGPQQEVNVLRQDGLDKRPRWVIMAYFEGNDLYDAAAYEQSNPLILARVGKYALTQAVEAWQEIRPSSAQAAVPSSERYPITVTINDQSLQMAFFSAYISWLAVGRDAIAASQNYRLVTDTLLQARQLSEAAGAQFLLVYVPTKLHVYLPFVHEAEAIDRIFTDVPTVQLDEAGYLQFTDQSVTAALTRQHMDDQAHLLAEFAAEQNMSFLDLTPYFQDAASTGVELYYPFDTHWSQQGHDLAAQTIAGFIAGR